MVENYTLLNNLTSPATYPTPKKPFRTPPGVMRTLRPLEGGGSTAPHPANHLRTASRRNLNHGTLPHHLRFSSMVFGGRGHMASPRKEKLVVEANVGVRSPGPLHIYTATHRSTHTLTRRGRSIQCKPTASRKKSCHNTLPLGKLGPRLLE